MQNLQELYNEKKATLSQLASITGFSVSTVSRYIKGSVKDVNRKYYDPILNALVSLNPCDKDVINQIDTDALRQQMMTTNFNSMTTTTDPKQQLRAKRGEIWYIKSSHTTGKEIWSGSQNRPCVIVQCNKLDNIGTYLVVYLTKQPKDTENPSFVTIKTNVISTAICSQLNAISRERLVNCVGKVTDVEMSLIERAILNALDIKINPKSEIHHMPDYIALKTELSVYKKIYEDYIRIHSLNNIAKHN